MNWMVKIAIYLAVVVVLPARAVNDAVHWAYEGEHGPGHWGDLSPAFVQCKVGVNQSPIDIVDTFDAKLPPLELDYTTSTVDLLNNGHTAQANIQPGSYLRVGDEEFELIQLHLHTPSEHRIDGKTFLMETHYVHRNANGELAVLKQSSAVSLAQQKLYQRLIGDDARGPQSVNARVVLESTVRCRYVPPV